MIQAQIGVPSKKENDRRYIARMKNWLSGELTFHPITHANFTKEMVMATVAFDKDNTIYVLMPKAVFETEEK